MNIYFYNFRLLHQKLRKFLFVYLNPFVWIINFNKIKLGKKIFFEHMEKNFPTFLKYYRYEVRTKFFFILFLILMNCFIFNVIFLIFSIDLAKHYFLILIISSLISILEAFIFIFQEEKFNHYQKQFYESKKYDFPIITFFVIIIIFSLWIYSFLII